MKNKIKIIKKKLETPCYICEGKGHLGEESEGGKICKVCGGLGIYKENYYYHIANGICFASEFIK